MPEKVTSLNGLKVTLEYCSYTLGAHNKDYVKSNQKSKRCVRTNGFVHVKKALPHNLC